MEERHLRGELPHYYNTMVAQMVMNECQRVIYFLTHVQRGNLRLTTATELEQVGHELAHPLDLLLDDGEGAPLRGIHGGLPQQGLDAQRNRADWSIKFMGDVAGQLAHGPQLGGLTGLARP